MLNRQVVMSEERGFVKMESFDELTAAHEYNILFHVSCILDTVIPRHAVITMNSS